MPFCTDCDRFYNPNTLTAGGDCPDGHHVTDPGGDEPPTPVPWHFKVMVVLVIAYLGWRLVEALAWVWGRIV
jgi:hypothetical protein